MNEQNNAQIGTDSLNLGSQNLHRLALVGDIVIRQNCDLETWLWQDGADMPRKVSPDGTRTGPSVGTGNSPARRPPQAILWDETARAATAADLPDRLDQCPVTNKVPAHSRRKSLVFPRFLG